MRPTQCKLHLTVGKVAVAQRLFMWLINKFVSIQYIYGVVVVLFLLLIEFYARIVNQPPAVQYSLTYVCV